MSARSVSSLYPTSDFGIRYHRRELLHTVRTRWRDMSENDRELLEARIVSGPTEWEGESAGDYVRRRSIEAATILGWLQDQECSLSKATVETLSRLVEADPHWRPQWDASADGSLEGRGGWITTEADPSKIIDAPFHN